MMPPQTSTPFPRPPFLERLILRHKKKLILFSFLLAFGAGFWINQDSDDLSPGERREKASAIQHALAISMLLWQYSNDHGGQYPQGHSSTEIFQQLLDQKYVDDPAFFYFPMEGKVKPISSRLKPENVSWDVTGNVQPGDPDTLPIVFTTGFQLTYLPEAEAGTPNVKTGGIAVAYKSNKTLYLSTEAEETVPGIIPKDFKPGDHPYQQLTPDGPLKY